MCISFFLYNETIPVGKDRLRISGIRSDLVYPGCFVSSNNVGLARYPDNWNRKYKERNSFRSKCQQCKQR